MRSRSPVLLLILFSAAGYTAAALLIRSDHSTADFLVFLTIFLGLSLLWAGALWLARRTTPSRAWILAAAILFRLLLLPAGYDAQQNSFQRLILYDDDLWRYLWEGHVWSAGINPLETPPAALEEFELEIDDPKLYQKVYDDPVWGEVFDNIGYRQFASPYHWMAHAVFRLSHLISPGSVIALRLVIIAFDMGVILLLGSLCRKLGLNDWPLLAYAWNPLVIKEFAGSAHIDVVLLFFLLAAVSVPRAASGLLALAALVKPAPLFLGLAFLRREGWRAILAPALAVAAWAFATPAGAKAYAESWVFNPALARLVPGDRLWQLALPALTVMMVAFWRARRDDGTPAALMDQAVWVLGAFLLTTPMVAPWYLTWIIPFAAIRRAWFWLALSVSIFLCYHIYLRMEENLWLIGLEYGLALGAWLWLRREGKTSPREVLGPGSDRGVIGTTL